MNQGGANMKRRALNVGPAKPAVPLPRKVQALIKMRESRGNRVINAGGGGCNMASSAAVSTVRNLPKVYSPLYEFSNLMLPRDLKTMNAWCLTGETLILTESFEWKPIKDLIAGEKVITHTGKIAPIKETTNREVDEEISEIFVKGSEKSISITDNHELYVLKRILNECKANHDNVCKFNQLNICARYNCKDKKMELTDVRARDLQVGDYLAYPINKDAINKSGWTIKRARLLGLYAAEGTANKNLQQVGLTFNIKEKDLVKESADSMFSEFGRKGCVWDDPKYNISRVYTTNKSFKKFVLKHCNGGSHTKKFSEEVMFLSPKLQLQIIGGYVDGDGHQYKNGRVVIDTMSSDLARQIQWMCYRNEINAYVNTYTRIANLTTGCLKEDTLFWRVEIPAKHSEELSQVSTKVKVYKIQNQRCDRFFCEGYLLTPITKINRKPFKGKVYNIEVDHKDHSYVTSVGAVHNSRHFFATNPIVRNAVTLHATYPISKFTISCEDPKIKEFFDEMFDRMGFRGLLMGIALEFWKLGERLDANSLITMSDGSVKKIIDVKVGDSVLTHTGSIKKVSAVIPKFTRAPDEGGNPIKIYKMKVVGSNEPLIITGNHPVYSELFEDIKCSVSSWADSGQKCWPNTSCSSTITKKGKTYPGCKKSKKWNMSFRKMSELSKNDQVAFAFNAEIKDIAELTEDWCKLLGYFLSEGCFLYNTLQDGSKVVCGIDIATTEKAINDDVASLIEKISSHPPGRILLKDGVEHVRMYNSELSRLIKRYCGEHASNKQMHQDLMLLPVSKQLILLGSFISGDGSVDISNGQIQISSSSRSLINQFILILARMGIGATLTNHTSKSNYLIKPEYNVKPNYRITIKSFDTEVFREVILPRKAELLNPATKRTNYGVVWNNLYVRSVQKIEDITDSYDKEIMYDLEVEDDHSYIANGIIVHNCFPYLELDEDNGVWDYAFLHNPDFVRVKTNQFARYPVIYLVPDDTLRRLVQGKTSADSMLRQQLPSETVHHIMKGEDIPLPNFNVSHMKMMNSEYDIRGTSLITSCYKDLMLYDKLREMQFAQADGMINPITLVKLGDPTGQWRPNDEDIRAFQQIMEESQYDPDFKIVTHGAVSIERIGYSGATLDVTQMWDAINKNLYTGLLAPEAILNGEGPNYSTASIGLEVLRTRYDRFREQLSEWIEKKVMEPICKLQDFYTTKGGVRKLVVPKVQWNRLNLRDTDSYIGAITGLLATMEAPGKVSDHTLYESLDLDPEEELKRMRKEAIDRAIQTQEAQALSKMTIEELQTLDPDKHIIDTHKGEEAPISPEQAEVGGPPGMSKPPSGPKGGGGGGLPPGGKPPSPKPAGGGGGGLKPPAGGEGGGPKPPAGGGGGAPPPAPKGPPPAP